MGEPLPTPFTSDGTRSTKYERIVEARGKALTPASTKNTLKESLVLEFVEHFRKQFIQLYPDRRPLILSPLNEAGTPKFVCTTLRPTLVPLKELYDVQTCARFLAAYLHYEPLEVPTEVPAYLPSPHATLHARMGDCFDMSVVLCSFLLGSGFDAYVVWGTAPKWVALRAEDRSKCGWTAPADAVSREQHTTPEALQLVPARKPAAAGRAEPPGVSRYKLPPPPSVASEFTRVSAEREGSEAAKRAASLRYESEEEGSDGELARLRRERAPREAGASRSATGGGTGGLSTHSGAHAAARGAAPSRGLGASGLSASGALGATAATLSAAAPGGSGDDDGDVGVSVDELHGQRIHAWVLVRAGRRGVTEHIFVEPSTGATYPVHASPYLSVEGAWNSRNYWVNMQAQPVLPRQPVGEDSQLSEAVAARLAASGSGAATPSGGDGRRSASGSRRYDRSKSPSATGTRNAGRFYFGGPGTPGGGGGAAGAGGARAEEGAAAGAGAVSASGVPAKLRGPYAASLDLPGVAARGLPAGAPALGAAALELALGKRPPLRGELAHRAGVSHEAAAAVPGSAAGAAPASAGGLRGRSAAAATAGDDSAAGSRTGSRAASRSRSRGHTKPGSSDGWRRDLAATQAALQAQVAQILLAQAAAVRGMDRMGYDFDNEGDWEVVMIPSEPAAARGGEDGAEEGGELGDALVSGSGSGSGGGASGLRAGGRSGFGGERKDGSGDADDGAGESTGRGGGAAGGAASGGGGSGGLGGGQLGVERDGEHVLDLPQSWVPRLVSCGGRDNRDAARSIARVV